MSRGDYWDNCIREACEDAKLSVTDEQVDTIVSWVEGCHENYGMAHGHDAIPNPLQTENDRLRRAHQDEVDRLEQINQTEKDKLRTDRDWLWQALQEARDDIKEARHET